MRHIQMYSSSADLRRGLTRALSLLVLDPGADERRAWWERLPAPRRAAARGGELGLEELSELLLEPELFAAGNRVRARLGVAPLEREQLRGLARRAIISGRAHAAHLGRDIYGESNKALWDVVVAPLGEAVEARWGELAAGLPVDDARTRLAPQGVRGLIEELVSLATGPQDTGHEACVAWLGEQLGALGFELELHRREGAPPVLEARRGARGLAGQVVLYGHYDTVGADAERWASDPDRVCEREGRWYARGIADNKGPLATRLWALSQLERTPALTWLIQGEEETGSVWSREVLAREVPRLDADLWLEETGYHDHADGTLRLLARTIGDLPDSSREPDPALARMLDGLRILAASAALATRTELRSLNKAVVAGGCPFNHALPPGARYLAVGVNDSHARIHAHDESLPTWAFTLHRDELALLFEVVDRIAKVRS
jgi:hypothetical protein